MPDAVGIFPSAAPGLPCSEGLKPTLASQQLDEVLTTAAVVVVGSPSSVPVYIYLRQ